MREKINEFKYILFHPEDGFYSMHIFKTGSVFISLVVALLWFFAELFTQQYTSFRYNNYNKTNINIIYIFIATFIFAILFSVSNWAICTLFDGEGSFSEILIVTGYSLFPYVSSRFIAIIMSYFLTINESTFVNFVTIIGLLYTVVLLCIGLIQIHDYSFTKMILSVFSTVIGVLLIVVLIFLLMTLFGQLFSFISSIFKEVAMHDYIGM
ncbi:MAG: YIP1 family protein [Clostridia bacterium]|nr:YIP1 family protein [Clostridia bacterium]